MKFRMFAALIAALFASLLLPMAAQGTTVTATLYLSPATSMAGNQMYAYGYDSCCNITRYQFDFGDGSATSTSSYYAPHRYTSPGTYTVKLTVTDSSGFSASTSTTETVVADQPPVARLTVSQNTSDTTDMSIYADASTSTDTDSTGVYYYRFYFGDGTSSSFYANSGSGITSHKYSSAGTYTVTVDVYDSAWNSGTATSTVQVPFGVNSGATVQENSPYVSLNGWDAPADSLSSGGTIRTSKVVGDFATFKFSGTSISWLTRKGVSQGKPTVYIDGVNKGSVDLYATSVQNYTKVFTGLSATTHTIKIQVTGSKNAASNGFNTAIDAFQVGGVLTQDTSPKITYDQWGGTSSANASGGAYRVANTSTSTSSYKFTGTTIDWITATGPADGKANVTIDGVNKGTVDLYAPSVNWKVAKSYSGLSSGSHTIRVQALGTKNASSIGSKVIVDAYTVR